MLKYRGERISTNEISIAKKAKCKGSKKEEKDMHINR